MNECNIFLCNRYTRICVPVCELIQLINLLLTQRLKRRLRLRGNSVSAEKKSLLHLSQRQSLLLPLTHICPIFFHILVYPSVLYIAQNTDNESQCIP